MKKILIIILLISRLFANEDINATLKKLDKESIEAYKNANYCKVIELEKEAYKLGSKESSIRIAMMYRFKLYEFDNAISWYQKGIDINDSESAHSLGVMYKDIKKYKLSEKYLLLAVNMGSENAIYSVGLLYDDKLNNNTKAIEWYKKAVEIDDKNGAFALGVLYRTEKKDYKEAEKWYIKALEMKHKKAPYSLARMYEEDLKEYQKALDVYEYFLVLHPNTKEVQDKVIKLKELLKK